MDAFDDAFGEGDSSPAAPPSTDKSSNGNGLLEEDADPAAEFLAREQSNFAGLEDEIPVVVGGEDNNTSPGGTGVTNGNGEVSSSNGNVLTDDFDLGGSGGFDGGSNGLGLDLDDNFNSSGGMGRPDSPVNGSGGPQYNVFIEREEPEKIKIWREEQMRRLEVKDAEEEESKDKLKEAARKELEDWYKNYDEQISKTRNSNRNAEQEGAAADASPTEEGKEWGKIADLCDFNPKSSKQQKDISRMRSLILQLKQNPPTSRRQSSAGSSSSAS